ncbi:MAG: TlyA family RNA methyltransferase [Anaerolineales bacterium]|jgi:23S rRNA (cytidine1920-2'-O)/16S rRNA (cytidine1409-2'-O)-methyltransferase
MAKKERVDILLVEQGLVESRSMAQRLIMAGQVRAEGQRVHKASQRFPPGISLSVMELPRYVSRGGEKLEAALQEFPIEVAGAICADVGSSTGGFTDCLLQDGAAKVYAIDVGKGLLHWSLRNDPRVILMEGVNARYLEELPEQVRIATIDAAFISLKLLLPTIRSWLEPNADVIALVKPQFEAGAEQVGKGGIVKDVNVHRQVLQVVMHAASELSLAVMGLLRSPITGAKGNVEFLLWLRFGAKGKQLDDLIAAVLPVS